ncbi:MFS transporter [Janibacter limosus]|uniref:MFS transporter n=1 Tax=Janibacter limosus TaxID=53458 RepID=UPI0035DE0E77
MRADARANRTAIVDAARRLYSERGPEIAFSAVAEEAGVGVGTLYRHFPTQQDLVIGIVEWLRDEIHTVCERWRPRMETDPADARPRFVADMVGMRVAAFMPRLIEGIDVLELVPTLKDTRRGALIEVEHIPGIARDAGLVDPSVSAEEFQMGLAVVSRPLPAATKVLVPDVGDWLVDVFVRGLRPPVTQLPADRAVDDAAIPSAQRWRILAVLLVAIFMSLVGVSIVNVAIPSIQHGLGASDSDVQWVLSGYALTFGVVLVAGGRAGDLLGRGGLFVIGATVFTLASVAAGLAPGAGSLNAARFVQGVGSGLLNPQGVGMIQQYFRGAERARAFGAFGSVVGVAVGIGPVIGGLLIELGGSEIGWRLTFLVNVPVGLLCIALAFLWFPKPLLRRPVAAEGQRAHGWRSLDPVGSLLLGLAVLATMLPFVEGGPRRSSGSPCPWGWPSHGGGCAGSATTGRAVARPWSTSGSSRSAASPGAASSPCCTSSG